MNKTLSVNIGGYIFNIEEDAYTQLRNYLDSISSYFAGQEGSDEIISDIEARIAELFNERLGTDRQVVINDDVEQVIIIMGKPEQYAEAEEDTQTSSKSKSNDNRRFYRDLDNSMIGGVCSGFSHHLGWDPVILRALFVLLLFTSIGIPLYIILWILIPAASSTAEKLKMKGQKINVENISKKINEEMDNVKSKFSSEGKTEGSKSVNKLIAGLGEFFSFIASFLRVVLGVLFLMLGIGMLIGFVIAIGGFSSGIPGNPELSISFLQDYIFFNPHMLSLAIIAAILLLVAPFLYFIYLGVRLLLRIQPPVKGVGIILLGMFILGSILASIAAINQAKEFNSEERIAIRQPQTEFASDTLIIRAAEDHLWHNQISIHRLDPWERLKIIDDEMFFADPHFRARPSDSEFFVFEIDYESSGASTTAALDYAEEITYNYELDGNTLTLDPFYSIPRDRKYRDQEVVLTVRIPKGKMIILDESTRRLVSGYYNWLGLKMSEIPGKTFVNVDGEIICSNCEEKEEEIAD
ncbi:MAG: phage shock protein PspC (stress-responsive transcriptional regulator) [Flavobacteriales bacterium]|jgi:phage shock protein PspC (stress-responsive transcriptional regulator)